MINGRIGKEDGMVCYGVIELSEMKEDFITLFCLNPGYTEYIRTVPEKRSAGG